MTKQKILIVDDEPDAVELVAFNLKEAGYEVATAMDGEEALTKARALLPQLLVLDLMLPEIDGLEVCKLLRRDPRTASIPSVMASDRASLRPRGFDQSFEGGWSLISSRPTSASSSSVLRSGTIPVYRWM